MQVIVADDDPVYRDLLRDLLTQWHFDVFVVSDGNEAWNAMQGPDAPRLVILDWMMPGLDGFEVCKMARTENLKQDVYIILLTGSRKKEEIMKVLVAGADDYLIKPFEPVDLKIHLRTARRILDLQAELAELRQQLHAMAGPG
jgi:DNA-binding response OmpR family regulator